MELYPHKSGLGFMEPVALINQNVGIYWNNTWSYYRVAFLEPIPPFQFLNLGAILAQAASLPVNAVNLDVKIGEFAQYRWFPIDNAQVRVWLPSASGRYSLMNLMVPVDINILDLDPCLHLTEFFVWEQNRPQFNAINGMDYPLGQCRLIGMGYRFITEALSKDAAEAIKAKREACTYIVCQGRQGG